jgi:uncharacterized protein (TIGR04255 family)
VEYTSLGYMPRAPLVYSLAMIEYATVPKMVDHADTIMEELRSEYPDLNAFNVTSLKIEIDAATGESKANQQVATQWRMNNPEGNFGLVFGTDRLVIQTTAYKHFDDFATKIRRIAGVVFGTANISYSKSIGIRHVDNIVPIDGMALGQLVKPGYMCPPQNEGLSVLNSRVEFVYASKYGKLYVRAYQVSNHPRVPQDLFPLANELSSDSGFMSPVTEEFVLADTDHVYSPNKLEPFDLDKIVSKLDALHQQCSLGFRQMVTEDAITTWKMDNG